MSYPIDKKALYAARYSKGTKLKLTAKIEDTYTPKEVGEVFISSGYVDDQLQLHGHWQCGGSIALVIEKDKFEIID